MTEKKSKDAVADALLNLDAEAREAAIPHQQDAPVKALSWYSEIGDQPQLRILSAGLFLSGALGRSPRMMRAGARMLLAHELATLAKDFVKQRVDRTRPSAAEDRDDQKAELGRSTEKEETSFPSGHSAGSTAVAAAFSREFPEYSGPALAAAGAAALAQIPRCAHYATDVGAGIAIGAAAEACVNLVWNALAPDRHDEC
jgi:membrane-associated phospholipid phosphatase